MGAVDIHGWFGNPNELAADIAVSVAAEGMTCPICRDWGRTVRDNEPVPVIRCPGCRRPTWPNLGVNCPAGCAAALATGNAIHTLRCLEAAKEQPDHEPIYGYTEWPRRRQRG